MEAELELEDNIKVKRSSKILHKKEYLDYFRQNIRKDKDAVFHNADLYPPHYKKVNAVTWLRTDEEVTIKERLQPINKKYPIHSYFMFAFTKTFFGKWRRENIYDPILFAKKKIHWRNYEASYDIAELQPIVAKSGTFVLQEYFIPVNKCEEFTDQISKILQRHKRAFF